MSNPPPDQASEALPDLRTQLDTVTRDLAQLTAQLEQERGARQQAETQAQQAAATAAIEVARARHITEIALRYKLPTELAKRLQGTTPAEIEADARQLAKSLLPGAWSSDAPTVAPGLVSDPAQSSRVNTLLDLVNGSRNAHPFRSDD